MFMSCKSSFENSYYKNKIEEFSNVNLLDDFQLLDFNSSFAIGDYNERFKIKLSEDDFNNVFTSIDSSQLRKVKNMDLYYLNFEKKNGDFLSIIFEPNNSTIQYSLNSE